MYDAPPQVHTKTRAAGRATVFVLMFAGSLLLSASRSGKATARWTRPSPSTSLLRLRLLRGSPPALRLSLPRNYTSELPSRGPPFRQYLRPFATRSSSVGISGGANKDQDEATRRYKKLTQREHVLQRPDTYIGSVQPEEKRMWIVNERGTHIEEKDVKMTPGFLKIFDEILVNAIDRQFDDKRITTIKVNVDSENGTISIYNDGSGIPIQMHKEQNMYIPTLIFGEFLSGENFDDSIVRFIGGRNGIGAKATNVFSTQFKVRIEDPKSKKQFEQTWLENMKVKLDPVVGPGSKNGSVEIEFKPDMARFGMKAITSGVVDVLRSRVYDAAACTTEKIQIWFNGEPLNVTRFQDYANLVLNSTASTALSSSNGKAFAFEKIIDKDKRIRAEIAVGFSQNAFQSIGFVNGIRCGLGTHIDGIVNQISQQLIDSLKKGKDKDADIKTYMVKNHLFVVAKFLVNNPSFDAQTKEKLVTPSRQFGFKLQLSDNFIKQVGKLGVSDAVLAFSRFKDKQNLERKSKKGGKIFVEKLDDALNAGKPNSHCTLILTEGDSAKALAVAGISEVGRADFGIYPLRGKPMNIRKASMRKIGENTEIGHLVKILGLEYGKTYTDLKSLRYKKVNVFSDQDLDGHHIAGLLINFVHAQWPSIFKVKPNFIERFATPIMKLKHKTRKDIEKSFFTLHEYNEWAKDNDNELKKWNIKYLKGLGSSTSKDAKKYFKALRKHTVDFILKEKTDDASIQLAFDPDLANDRKEWLLKYDDQSYIDYSVDSVTIKDFFDQEFIHFSNYDNIRSIPCAIDGLKPTQRKVLYGMLKNNQVNEIKVSQLTGRIAEMSNYHHGEASLVETICGMAQDHLGTNNVNYLVPEGQFGSRLTKPSIHAQPRYIYTALEKLTRFLFREEDDQILEYIKDEGVMIEPVTYYPILPTALFNGATGIGTGWSTDVPCYHPLEVADALEKIIAGDTTTRFHLLPFYDGFRGPITCDEDDVVTVSGVWRVQSDRVEIFELPVSRWTDDFITEITKKFSTQSGNNDRNERLLFIKDIDNLSTESKVHIVLHCDKEKLYNLEKREGGVAKLLRLNATVRTSNMWMFEPGTRLRKFEDTDQIIRYFYKIRRVQYQRRKDYQINALKQKIMTMTNQYRFIEYVMQGKLKLFNRPNDELEKDMLHLKLEKMGDPESFDYLLKMPFLSATREKLERLSKSIEEAKKRLEELIGTTIDQLWTRDIQEFRNAYVEFHKKKCDKYGSPVHPKGERVPPMEVKKGAPLEHIKPSRKRKNANAKRSSTTARSKSSRTSPSLKSRQRRRD